MADTTNFGWTKPTVSGSSGAWGTLLNTALDDIDADLEIVDDKADAALAENLNFPIISAGLHAIVTGEDPKSLTERLFFRSATAGILIQTDAGAESHTLNIPIQGLAPGMRITGFKSRGQAPANTIVTVALHYIDTTPTAFVVSSGHSHGTSQATLTLSSLTHNVVADRQYYFSVAMSRSSGTEEPTLWWVQPVVSRL